MTAMTGARAFWEMLKAEGVQFIFGNPGTSESALMALLPQYPDLKYILATQEGTAMGMADGYALGAGKPAVVNLHIETGLANGISLLHHARDGGVPLVLTSGNKDIRKLAEGRTDLTEMVRQFTKLSLEVTHPEQTPGALRRAFQTATTAPTGPVYVGFAANALDATADMEIIPATPNYLNPTPNPEAVRQASQLLAGAVNPVLVVGDRLAQSQGTAEAVKLAEAIGAAVYATSLARMNFPSSHPQFLGRINLPLSAARRRLAEADVILAVGTDVFSGFFYLSGPSLNPQTRLIHLDSDYQAVGKTHRPDVALLGDPKSGLSALERNVADLMTGAGREAAQTRRLAAARRKAQGQEDWQRRLKAGWDARPMVPERMMYELAQALPPEAIIIDDSLSSKDALHGALQFDRRDAIFGERIGAIGWGMGAALGLKLAYPQRPVVAIVGDGSAMMTAQALWTAAAYNIPAVYLICNNRSYRILKVNMNLHRQEILGQELPEGHAQYVGMDFPLPLNLAGIANAIGVYGKTIADPAEIAPELKRALNSGRPAVLDVVIDQRL